MDRLEFLITILKPVRKILFFSTLLAAAGGIGNTALLALINYSINNPQRLSFLTIYIYIGLLLIVFCMESVSQILFSNLSQGIVFNLQTKFCKNIFFEKLDRLEKIGKTNLYAILTQDINSISAAAFAIPALLINIFFIISCLLYIYFVSWQAFLIVLSFIFLSFCFFLVVDIKILKRRFENSRKMIDQLFDGFQGVTEGIKELKLNNKKCEHFFNDEIVSPANQSRIDNKSAMNLYAIVQSSWKSCFFILCGALLFLFPYLKVNIILLSSQFIVVVLFLMSPLSSIISFLPALQRSIVAFNHMSAFSKNFSLSNNNIFKENIINIHNCWREVSLKNITYTFSETKGSTQFTLGPLNISFNPGELIFLRGNNGSGKSTFAKLLTGLYSPSFGEIYLDNIKIDNKNIEWYQEHFSVVFSDFYLFKKLYGFQEKAIDNKVTFYLKKLQLDHKVSFFNKEFSTVKLSDGQQKRLALLISHLENRPFCIFDELGSNQDPAFKNIFYKELIPLIRENNRCILVISHDDSYFFLADRILTLENGLIKEETIRSNG